MQNHDFLLSDDGLVVSSARWRAIPDLTQGITTRLALPDPGKGDFFDSIAKARESGALRHGLTFGADQIHSDRLTVIDGSIEEISGNDGFRWDESLNAGEFPKTDALVATRPNAILVIQTADCLPVFAIDADKKIAGLAHCGWRGLRANLTGKLIERMVSAGAQLANIQVWLGPCIHARNYEVSRELVEDFRAAFPGAAVAIDDRHLDLSAIADYQLVAAGVRADAIADSGQCTYAGAERYHSWRAHGPNAGRMLSFVGFRE